MFNSQLQQQRAERALVERQMDLIARVSRLAPVDGIHHSRYAPLAMFRRSIAQPVVKPAVYEPSLVFVVQGRKRVVIDGEMLHYDALNYLVVSVTLPVTGQIVEASVQEPYLCLKLDLDLEEISRLILQQGVRVTAPAADRGLYVTQMDEPLLDALLRLVKLLDAPEEIPVLAPDIRREIYYRVLRGPLANQLTNLLVRDAAGHRVLRAIDWLKQRYAEPLRIEELADEIHMSASALHHRFKAVTAMSPLQFQKHLRLHEARRLMFMNGLECAAAGHRVGYESASQFSREYRRLFGAPPSIEIARLREEAATL